MPKYSIISIDGPAASGKTTLGRRLADALGYLFFDTGVMYRAVTWLALQRGLDINDEPAVTHLAEQAVIDIRPPSMADGRACDVLADSADVTWETRRPEVDANVSQVSTYGGVRKALTAQQRRIGLRGRVVMVGRDIGTVVLPEADLKIYLDASVGERAQRRYQETFKRGEKADFEEILSGVRKRDEIDSTRSISPLRAAEDAVIIDSEQLNVDEVFAKVETLAMSERSEYRLVWWRKWLARPLLRILLRLVFHILSPVKITGKENIPFHKPYIAAINHISLFEAPLVGGFWPEQLEVIGASDIWNRPGQNILARLWGGIPVHRGDYDRAALEGVLAALRCGYPVMIAPEGGRSHSPGMRPAKAGIAYLAEETGMSVIPVGIVGTTDDFWHKASRGKRPHLEMHIGKPFRLPPVIGKGEARRESRQRNADLVMAHIAGLLPENYRGVYGDSARFPDTEAG